MAPSGSLSSSLQLMIDSFVLNANGKDNDRNALVIKFSLDREDGVVMEHA